MRLIDADRIEYFQAPLSGLEIALKKDIEEIPTVDAAQYEQGYRDGFRSAYRLYPVEHKLPEESRDCLVVVEIGYFNEGFFRAEVRSARYDAENNSWHVHRSEKPEYIGEVKAWMPLPDSWEGEK
jgi:hypothetical protein